MSTCTDCVECAHCIVTGSDVRWCTAPQLADVLDDELHKNDMIQAHAARDVKVACGHAARWFTPKVVTDAKPS